jgi:hypothetical protein
MRSQLRLRVLLPVAVLGLLGIGFGAFAMGGPPEADAPLPPPPTTTAKEDPPPLPPSLDTWAAGANKVCGRANNEVRALGLPKTAEQTVDYFKQVLDIAARTEPEFVALGWPEGKKAPVKRLWALFADERKTAAELLGALQAGDVARFLRLSSRLEASADEFAEVARRLGARRCAQDSFAPTDSDQGLAGALEKKRIVVVLFYAPRSAYDAIQAREARAGAAAAGAGFLAVNAARDRDVAALAAAFEVLDAPAVVIVKRGYRVAARIHGFADRETVAQAVANARM